MSDKKVDKQSLIHTLQKFRSLLDNWINDSIDKSIPLSTSRALKDMEYQSSILYQLLSDFSYTFKIKDPNEVPKLWDFYMKKVAAYDKNALNLSKTCFYDSHSSIVEVSFKNDYLKEWFLETLKEHPEFGVEEFQEKNKDLLPLLSSFNAFNNTLLTYSQNLKWDTDIKHEMLCLIWEFQQVLEGRTTKEFQKEADALWYNPKSPIKKSKKRG